MFPWAYVHLGNWGQAKLLVVQKTTEIGINDSGNTDLVQTQSLSPPFVVIHSPLSQLD